MTVWDAGLMSDDRFNPYAIPSWPKGELPTVEECEAATRKALDFGASRVVVTNTSSSGFDDVYGEAPPVDDRQLSTRPDVSARP